MDGDKRALSPVFTKLVRLIRPSTRVAPIPMSDIEALFLLQDERVQGTPGVSLQVFSALHMSPGVRESFWGYTRGLYAHPHEKIMLRTPPSDIAEIEDEDPIEIRSSAALFFNIQKRRRNRWGLSILIRTAMKDVHHPANAFALYGTYGQGTPFTVRKIYLPVFDERGEVAGDRRLPLWDDSVTRALLYAQLCIRQITGKRPLTPQYNMKIAESMAVPAPVQAAPKP